MEKQRREEQTVKKSSRGSHLAERGEENREDRHRRWGRPPRDAGDGVAQASGMDAGVQQEDEDAGAGLGEGRQSRPPLAATRVFTSVLRFLLLLSPPLLCVRIELLHDQIELPRDQIELLHGL